MNCCVKSAWEIEVYTSNKNKCLPMLHMSHSSTVMFQMSSEVELTYKVWHQLSNHRSPISNVTVKVSRIPLHGLSTSFIAHVPLHWIVSCWKAKHSISKETQYLIGILVVGFWVSNLTSQCTHFRCLYSDHKNPLENTDNGKQGRGRGKRTLMVKVLCYPDLWTPMMRGQFLARATELGSF